MIDEVHTREVTPAITQLEAEGVEFVVREFAPGETPRDAGLIAADRLGLDPGLVFKTLVVSVDGSLAVAIVPVSAKLSLKSVGAALGSKRVEMADPTLAERATGYVRGGISPFGQRRRLPTLLDETALRHEEIYVSGGKRGVDIGVAPGDLVRVLDAVVAQIGV